MYSRCQDVTYGAFCKAGGMTEPFERLQEARRRAGFAEATEAARAYGWNSTTYLAHENGTRGLRPAVADRYAKAYRVKAEWLLYGRRMNGTAPNPPPRTVALVGYVAAGAEAHFTPAGELGQVEATADATDSTVAVEMRGDSWGTFFDRWIVYYDEVRRPVTQDLIGKPCVVGLEDGRVLVKRLQRSRTKGLFHLFSPAADPIMDVAVEWAAKVKSMVPR